MFHVTVRVPEMSPPAFALSEASFNASLQEGAEKATHRREAVGGGGARQGSSGHTRVQKRDPSLKKHFFCSFRGKKRNKRRGKRNKRKKKKRDDILRTYSTGHCSVGGW